MTVFCPENGGSRYISNRLHGVTSQHVVTLKVKVMRKENLTRNTTALYVCILLVPRPFENRKQSVKHCQTYADIKPPKPSGHYTYRQFNNQQFHVLPTQCVYVFCVDLRTNSDYFTKQH